MLIDKILFYTNVLAAIGCWTFWLYYLTRFRWEAGNVGRYINLACGALTALVTTGLLRRFDTRLDSLYLAPEIDMLSAVCYGCVAAVFFAAAYQLVQDARKLRRNCNLKHSTKKERQP